MATPFNEFLGTRLISSEPGQAVLELQLQDHHLNKRGVAHGGVISSLLDSALGGAVISSIPREWWCATTSLHVQFIAGPRADTIRATGKVIKRGSSVAFAEGQVRDSADRLLATATGTWKLWSRKPGSKPSEFGRIKHHKSGKTAVGKVVAVGRNYVDHVREMGGTAGDPPVLFLKPTEAVFCGDHLPIPSDHGSVHHEVELAVLVGQPLEKVSSEEASAAIAGYAVGLDLTLRDLQSSAKKMGTPWASAKGFKGSAPLGAFVLPDEFQPANQTMKLVVNGQVRQQASLAEMERSVPELLAYASEFFVLSPGDILLSGTPAGVGPIGVGDQLEATIEGLPGLSLTIR